MYYLDPEVKEIMLFLIKVFVCGKSWICWRSADYHH